MMQIDRLAPESGIKEAGRLSTDYHSSTPSASQSLENNAGTQTNTSTGALNMPARLLERWDSILANFRELSLWSGIKEIVGVLAAIKHLEDISEEILELIYKTEDYLLPFKRSLEQKNFSAEIIKNMLKLYCDSEDLKSDLLRLVSLLEKGQLLERLKAAVDKFINSLEKVNSYNKEEFPNLAEREVFLYFPFTLSLEDGREEKLGLIINPEFDKKGKLKTDSFSFTLVVEAPALGLVNMLFRVRQNRVSSQINVQTPLAQEVIESNIDGLSDRLKSINFLLNSCNCRVLSESEKVLPRLEMEA